MKAKSKANSNPRILLVFKTLETHNIVTEILKKHYSGELEVTSLNSLQSAIEVLENETKAFPFIIFEHQGVSQAMVRLLTQMGGLMNYVMFTDEKAPETVFKFPEVQMDFVSLDAPNGLLLAIKKVEIAKEKENLAAAELEYVAVQPEVVQTLSPLQVDVFVRLGDGRFLKIFKKGDVIQQEDMDKYTINSSGVQQFYFKKSEYNQVLNVQTDRIEALSKASDLTEEQGKALIQESQNLLRDLVLEMGFTPAAQAVAKASVEMTLKLVGTRPRLKMIFNELKSIEGSYISAHSFILGKLACALAYKIGWQSAGTYLKLSMAAFLHDLPLKSDDLAKETSYKDALMKQKYTPDELKILRFHPARAAEYAAQFTDIPSDVDQIVAQHHERPDGSGFPRGITAQFISPLSALFIIAHEMIEYSMAFPDAPMDKFFEVREADFSVGQFRKIFTAIRNDGKLG